MVKRPLKARKRAKLEGIALWWHRCGEQSINGRWVGVGGASSCTLQTVGGNFVDAAFGGVEYLFYLCIATGFQMSKILVFVTRLLLAKFEAGGFV